MQVARAGRVDRVMADLRAGGQRVTPARRAVVEVLDAVADQPSPEHLSADVIVERAAGLAPGVHRATVYRALTTLTELGLVSHTHVAGGAAVYHLATVSDPSVPAASARPHAHLQCVACGRILDVPAAVLEPLRTTLRTGYDFALDPGHVALLGTCADCHPT